MKETESVGGHWFSGYEGMWRYGFTYDQWKTPTANKFIGIKSSDGTNTYNGYIKMSVDASKNITVHQYGCNITLNTEISIRTINYFIMEEPNE